MLSELKGSEPFNCDAAGNRLTDSKATGDWVYEDDDSLVSRPGVTYKYDVNGSMVEKDDNGTITRYVYDVTGRMVEVRDRNDSLIASYAYDPFGRRIKKTVNGSATYFLYSDEGLIAETDSVGNVTRQYGWQLDGTWGTDPLYLVESGDAYYYQNDHLGTPQKLISQSGAVVWSANYESFGQAHVDAVTVDNPLRFSGQYYDNETGTHYNYFRDYEPKLGRYIESDPIGLLGGGNSYRYSYNQPTKNIDPKGLYDDCDLYDPGVWVDGDIQSEIVRDDTTYYDWSSLEFDAKPDAQLPAQGKRHPLNNPPICPAVMVTRVFYRTYRFDYAEHLWVEKVKIEKYMCKYWSKNKCTKNEPTEYPVEVPIYDTEDLGTHDRKYSRTYRTGEGFTFGLALCPKYKF